HGTGKKQPPTLICMDNQDRDWAQDFGSSGRSENALIFSDYAVVVQAALLGQGMALGWLTVVSNSLVKGELVPAVEQLRVTSRRCCLVTPASRPVRPVVENIRDWIIEEMRADLLQVDALYPHLGLATHLEPVR
ncbi:MAG: LysR substrate-binding domain-containing protein, partial [Pseudomonas caspiana]